MQSVDNNEEFNHQNTNEINSNNINNNNHSATLPILCSKFILTVENVTLPHVLL